MDKKTIDRIKKNEERLDNINTCIKNVENALAEFKENKKSINMLNKYYGSANWFKDKEALHKGALDQVHDTFAKLMKCAEDHERTVCDHAKKMYDTFDENSRRRTEGVHSIIAYGKELLATIRSDARISSFARELQERDLRNLLLILQSVLKTAPTEDAAIMSVEDHRKLLLNMKIVTISRNFRLTGGSAFHPIDIDSFKASRSVACEVRCEDQTAHDGGAIIDPVRRIILNVSGNCNNGKDVFLIDIDKKTSERFRNIIPYGNHGQYPVFDGDRRVYFFESESGNRDRFGFFDLESKTFTSLKKCPVQYREFCSPCFMDGKIYAVGRDKFVWVYNTEDESWKRLELRVGKVRLAADPFNQSLVVIKKNTAFYMYNVETKTKTDLPVQPRTFNLGSNQEFLFLRRTEDDFIAIASFDSHSLYAYISKEKRWTQLNWRDVRNGSAHLVFDPVTSAFYYKIDGERSWYSAPVKME